MKEISIFIAPGLALIGVIVGAVLQYFLSRSADARKKLVLLRSQAYVDYLRAVVQAAHKDSENSLRAARTAAADAKSRISVYGCAKVVQALADFERAGPCLDNEKSCDRFLEVVAAMRRKNKAVSVDCLSWVLFGKSRN